MTNATRVASLARDESGFTLVELLVVLIVLAILSTTILLGVGQFQNDAAAARDTVNARQCYTAKMASRVGYGNETQFNRYLSAPTSAC